MIRKTEGMAIILLGSNIGRVAVEERARPVGGPDDLLKVAAVDQDIPQTRLERSEKRYG